MVYPRKATNWARKSWSTKPHETGTKGLSTKQARKVHPRKHTNLARNGLSAYLAPLSRVPLHLYSLCTSAPIVLRPRKGANPARKAYLTNGNFYTLLINIGSIVPGAPAALGIGAASFDGEGGDVDGKDTAESPTA